MQPPFDIKKSLLHLPPGSGAELCAEWHGFFVGVKNEKNPEIVNAYLVMAKHVLERAPDQPYSTIAARRWEVEQLLLNAAHTIYFSSSPELDHSRLVPILLGSFLAAQIFAGLEAIFLDVILSSYLKKPVEKRFDGFPAWVYD